MTTSIVQVIEVPRLLLAEFLRSGCRNPGRWVSTSRGTTIACWRIIGDNVYLTQMTMVHMRDAMVPLSAVDGDVAVKLQGMTSGNIKSTAASKTRASTITAMQEGVATGGPSGNYPGRIRSAVRPNIT